jgi:hypothetical protein
MKNSVTHKFVELIPDVLEDGVLYISIPHCVAIHKCICGCGNEVVTPIAPNGWRLSFDGETVSLSPSIGNWNFECRSHYFIRNNQIITAKSYEYEQDKSIKKKKKKSNKKKFFRFWNK